jgi:biotin carboxyl carrier protein
MELELKIKDRTAKVQLLEQKGSIMTFLVDGNEYKIDLERVSDGIYSVIHKGKSYNVEMVEGLKNKQYIVNTFYNSYEVEVIDAETKYLRSRNTGDSVEGENSIVSPMPGKVVKILVKPGDEVEAGQTIIIVSAMKMESEFKAKKAGRVKVVHVNEGDLVEGNKMLVSFE